MTTEGMQRRSSYVQPLVPFSVSVDRSLTRILLATSDVEPTTTPENNDGLCGWATAEARGAAADCEPAAATREVAEPTRSMAGRYGVQALLGGGTTCFSYGDLKEGGCVDGRTLGYVPDSGAYTAWKAAAKLQPRRCYGLGGGRVGKIKAARGGEAGGASSRADDALTTPAPPRDAAVRQPQRTTSRANQTDGRNGGSEPVEQTTDTGGDAASPPPREKEAREKDARRSRGRRNSGETTAGACCSGDVDSTEKSAAERGSADGRVKTWVYNFLPPIAMGHGDPDPLRGNWSDVRGHGQRTASCSRGYGRRAGDERRPTGKPRPRDPERGGARQAPPPPPPAAGDAAEQSRGGHAAVDVERRRRRLFPDSPTGDRRVFLTEVCPSASRSCDCAHRRDAFSDDDDAVMSASRFADDDDDDDNDETNNHNSTDDDDDDDNDYDGGGGSGGGGGEEEEGDEKKENEALESYSARKPDAVESRDAGQCLQISVTGRVVGVHRRHEETCES